MVDFDLGAKYNWVDTSSPQFNYALDKLINTDENLLIIGPGGTGKSLLLELAYNILGEDESCIVVTPTGVSASNLANKGVKAVTIHSAFDLSNSDLFERKLEVGEEKSLALRNVDILIFDEISMVNAATFDQMDFILGELRKLSKYPRIIMFGDVLQLPPVVRDDEKKVADYYSAHFGGLHDFSGTDWWKGRLSKDISVIILDKIYRQDDSSFQNILNRIRLNKPTDQDIEIINSRVCPDPAQFFANVMNMNVLYLAGTNRIVDELNSVYVAEFKGRNHRTYKSRATGRGIYLPQQYETLYVGEQVMCTFNHRGFGFQNGTLAKVKEIYDDFVVAIRSDGVPINIPYMTRNIYDIVYDYKTHKPYIDRVGTISMIACTAAFAITIHKSQSLTLDSVFLDFRGWVPDRGVYLALSRVKSLDGVQLLVPIERSHIHVDQHALDLYDNLKNMSKQVDLE